MKNKQYFIILVALVLVELLATIDTTGVTVLVPTLQKFFNIPEELAGWILLAYLIPLSLMMIPIGYLADRINNPEKVMRLSVFGFLVFCILCAFSPNIYYLMIFRILKGICAAGIFTTEFVIIIKYWKEPRRIVEIVVLGLAIGVLIGPIVGGYFAQGQNWRWFFLIGAILSGFSFFGFNQLKNLTPIIVNEEKVVEQKFWLKFKYLSKFLFWGILINFITSFAAQGINFLITIHTQNTLHQTPLYNSYILAVLSFGAISANGLGLGSKFKKIEIAAITFSILFALTLVLLNLTSWIDIWAWVIYFCMGLALGVILSTTELMFLNLLSTNDLALGNGILATSIQAGFAVSALVPILYLHFGVNSVYFLSGSTVIVFALYAICKKLQWSEALNL